MDYRTDIEHTLPLIIDGLLVQEDVQCIVSMVEDDHDGMIVERIEAKDLRRGSPPKVLAPAWCISAADTVLWQSLCHAATLDGILKEKFFRARDEDQPARQVLTVGGAW